MLQRDRQPECNSVGSRVREKHTRQSDSKVRTKQGVQCNTVVTLCCLKFSCCFVLDKEEL
jgi:hypothetical protein